MKKNRNLIKIFLTLVQIFVLGLPLFAFCFNAVAYRLGLKDLATSVSGNTESSIDESTFLNETNDINKFALQSIYDFNYINKGQEITSYEYQTKYPSNYVYDYTDFVVGNWYFLQLDDEIAYSLEDWGFVFDESITFNTFCVIDYINYSDIDDASLYLDFPFYLTRLVINFDDSSSYSFYLNFQQIDFMAFAGDMLNFRLIFQFNDTLANNIQTLWNTFFKYFKYAYADLGYDYNAENYDFAQVYERTSTTSELIDIPSFISATEGMSYEDIVSNNYVNTHLLLNLDIVGLFTNNLSGNAYVYLWLNYFMNYLLTMSIVFICFDVIMYFILIVRKILDRSVEYTDRREF